MRIFKQQKPTFVVSFCVFGGSDALAANNDSVIDKLIKGTVLLGRKTNCSSLSISGRAITAAFQTLNDTLKYVFALRDFLANRQLLQPSKTQLDEGEAAYSICISTGELHVSFGLHGNKSLIYGDAVTRSQRVAELGLPGKILMTADAYSLFQQQNFKGIQCDEVESVRLGNSLELQRLYSLSEVNSEGRQCNEKGRSKNMKSTLRTADNSILIIPTLEKVIELIQSDLKIITRRLNECVMHHLMEGKPTNNTCRVYALS